MSLLSNPWILALRPKTLPAAIAPVVIATSMAFGDGVGHWPSASCALLAALLIQIGTNLANDYFDFKKGADINRIGPIRVTQAGLIKPTIVLIAACIAFFLAFLASLYLIQRAGQAILIIALASIVSGFCYTAGKKPLAYIGLGELFVLIFFGPVAVVGTYYVQSFEINSAVIIAGLAPGFISCAIIAVNNLRDLDGDRRANKMTLAVRFGRAFAMREYLFFIMAATLVPFLVMMVAPDHAAVASASIIGFLAIPLMSRVCANNDPEILNQVLAKTGMLLLCYAFIFSLGWLLCSR